MTLGLSEKDRQFYLDAALRAADWFVAGQLCQYRPMAAQGDSRQWRDNDVLPGGGDASVSWTEGKGRMWDANRGRFPYYYFMPDGRHVPGLSWTQGRGIFVLADAYKITGDSRYLETAEFAADYIASLQFVDPHFPQVRGAIREHTPTGAWAGSLDAAQAASALILLTKVGGDKRWLARGREFCDYLMRHFDEDRGMPRKASIWPEEIVEFGDTSQIFFGIGQCAAIPLWHLFKLTGEKKYLRPLIVGADIALSLQRSDGAMNCYVDITDKKPPSLNHHWGAGEGDDRFLVQNDDGLVTLILAAHEATGDKKYLDAAVAYMRWIITNTPAERPYCVFPVWANNVLDVGKVSGEDHSDWVLDHLQSRLLDLQVTEAISADPKALGGFRGEDEEGDSGVFGGVGTDYVVTRTTCYAAGTLFRLSGKGTGAGFSVFGV